MGDRRAVELHQLGSNSGALISGFVVEFDAVPEPAPSSLLALSFALLLGVTRPR